MKKLTIVLSFLFMIVSYNISAQSNSKGFDDAGFENNKELKNEIRKIRLSSSEETKFKAITKKYIIQYEGVMESNVSEDKRTQTINDIQVQKNSEMKNFLNDKQFETYLELQMERQAALKNIKKA